ncbi:large subunit ribosomal protein L24e [Pancytospora epiphaga]|nr:large subunit ribosomal protein L24e [Pancytospora epiphaga]
MGMRIQKCWFCSANIYPGHGVTFVRNDASVFRFCRSKCRKLFDKRLNPRKMKWTKICRMVRNKELSEDPVLAFERRVHIPMIYDRAVVQQTVDAIPKILAMRKQREDMFIKARILGAKEESKARDLEFIEKHQRLLERDTTLGTQIAMHLSAKKDKKEMEYN